MSEFLKKSDIVGRLMTADPEPLNEAQVKEASSIVPDWRIFPRLTKSREEGTIELSRTFAVPKFESAEERNTIISKFFHLPGFSDNINDTPEIPGYFDSVSDDVRLSTIRLVSSRRKHDAWYFKLNLHYPDSIEKPPITLPIVGGIVKVDLMLAGHGMEIEPAVDLDNIRSLGIADL